MVLRGSGTNAKPRISITYYPTRSSKSSIYTTYKPGCAGVKIRTKSLVCFGSTEKTLSALNAVGDLPATGLFTGLLGSIA